MRKFGLIGYPLGHSFSKGYFGEKFRRERIDDAVYENFPMENVEDLPDLVSTQKDLLGLNVTIPHKEAVFSILDEVDPEADKIGAVNTIRIYREGTSIHMKGFNTDVYGFEKPLLDVLQPVHNKALVLGTGGAAKAVAYILDKHRIHFKYVSRTPRNERMLSYDQLTPDLIREHKLIINTSPIGMSPNTEDCPRLPYDAITPEHILYDLIYNPEQTLFLRKGSEKKASLINGLPMLYLQAERSWEIWNAD